MDEEIKQNLKATKTWIKGFYIILFSFFYAVAKVVIFAVVVFQFLLTLFTGKTNDRLLKLGQGLSTYMYQILLYITFNSDQQPYPFGAWPKGPPSAKRPVAEEKK